MKRFSASVLRSHLRHRDSAQAWRAPPKVTSLRPPPPDSLGASAGIKAQHIIHASLLPFIATVQVHPLQVGLCIYKFPDWVFQDGGEAECSTATPDGSPEGWRLQKGTDGWQAVIFGGGDQNQQTTPPHLGHFGSRGH